MPIELTLENVLAVVIGLITLNLLFIGFYIVSVLREVKKTVHRAGEVIDEVDKTVKDGVEKAKAMNKPLQALATTATAFGGIVKSGDAIRKATQSILGGNDDSEGKSVEVEKTTVKKKGGTIEAKKEKKEMPLEIQSKTPKRIYKKPRFFKKK